MSRLLPGDRIGLESELRRGGEILPAGALGTIVSVDVDAGSAEVDWDVPSKLVLRLNSDPFWIQLCSGLCPSDEGRPSTDSTEEGLF
jgi:hypothetical protein